MSLGSTEVTSEDGSMAGVNDVEAKLMIVWNSNEGIKEDEVEGRMKGVSLEGSVCLVVEGKGWMAKKLSNSE